MNIYQLIIPEQIHSFTPVGLKIEVLTRKDGSKNQPLKDFDLIYPSLILGRSNKLPSWLINPKSTRYDPVSSVSEFNSRPLKQTLYLFLSVDLMARMLWTCSLVCASICQHVFPTAVHLCQGVWRVLSVAQWLQDTWAKRPCLFSAMT